MCVCVYVCVHWCAWVCVCLCLCTLVCVRVCMCMCVQVSAHAYKNIFIWGSRSEHIFVSQGLVFICCVSTLCHCSTQWLTLVITPIGVGTLATQQRELCCGWMWWVWMCFSSRWLDCASFCVNQCPLPNWSLRDSQASAK